MDRQIIQICSSSDSGVFVLCSDGSIWNLWQGRKWRLLPEIPQGKPSYKAYLDECINDLRIKDRVRILSEDEKKELLDLLEQRKKYEFFIR
ncbi:hypothetical protein [Gallibacterium genomosp. 1]|uniref:Uncharacterized protein n=1 Tax=Gallibacterium genomosp. 1 TaxID=155515 RepID=A0A0A2XWP4_9PAST|nr:hypothetical protein [Gallibacterium genomosp. 1]KGQ36836.1 hypothetical protein JP36_08940 [Gallibacterium genomosp. 1]